MIIFQFWQQNPFHSVGTGYHHHSQNMSKQMSGLAHRAGTEGTAEWISKVKKSPEHLSITSEPSTLYFEHLPVRLHLTEAQEEPQSYLKVPKENL